MRTLIVPCAGNHKVEGVPLYLNRHPDGEILAVKSIMGIYPQDYDRIIYTILQEDDEKYNASEIIKNECNERFNIEVVILPQKTNGPAETVYKTLIIAGINGEFVVRDSHVYIEVENEKYSNFVAGLDLTECKKTIDDLKSRSFIILNEQKKILDIVEKHFCSDVISLGLYGFNSADEFIVAYKHLCESLYPISKLYLSHIISYLIGYRECVFHSIKITKFEDWSTNVAWKKVQKRYATCFLDLDGICNSELSINEKAEHRLISLSEEGVSFVVFTSKLIDENSIKEYFQSKGIRIISVVTGCTNSSVRKILSNNDSIEEMYLEAQ